MQVYNKLGVDSMEKYWLTKTYFPNQVMLKTACSNDHSLNSCHAE